MFDAAVLRYWIAFLSLKPMSLSHLMDQLLSLRLKMKLTFDQTLEMQLIVDQMHEMNKLAKEQLQVMRF